MSAEGFPVTVFEAFHELGGVLRYGIPGVPPAERADRRRGRQDRRRSAASSSRNFVVGKTATLEDLKDAGFWKIFVGTGAGLPRFMNVPGEHLLGVMSANEFLTRVNLMQGASTKATRHRCRRRKGKQVIVIGGGNTAMDAARTARRLGGNVTIVYRRTQSEMPVRVEELHHALEEGIELKVLRAPREFIGDEQDPLRHATPCSTSSSSAPPDASGRRSPVATGKTETMAVDLAIMALGNTANPIIKDAEPDLKTTKWGTIEVEQGSQETSIEDVYSGGDAARGGSTAIRAAGDGQAAARRSSARSHSRRARSRRWSPTPSATPSSARPAPRSSRRSNWPTASSSSWCSAPLVAKAAQAGQFVRVLAWDKGELIPLTLADWDAETGTIDLVDPGHGHQHHRS